MLIRKLKNKLIISICILGMLWIIGNSFTTALQHHFIFKPEELDVNLKYPFQSNFEEIDLPSAQGGVINALWFKDKTNHRGVILYFHGNSGNLLRWGPINDDFSKLGYDLFIMDYRGFGKSKGPISEDLFYQDAMTCYRFVESKYDEEDILIYGRSIGSAMASYLSDKVIARAVILETPFYSMKDLFYSYYPFLPRLFFFNFPFLNFKYLENSQLPIYIFHGTNDWVVPYRCGSKLKQVLKPGDEFVTIEDGSHSDLVEYSLFTEKLNAILSK